jgi:hypothetical protein
MISPQYVRHDNVVCFCMLLPDPVPPTSAGAAFPRVAGSELDAQLG